jgi:hypothetical protein
MTLTEYERDIVTNVAEYGCHITSVFGDEDSPPFTYSVGLWETVDAADVILVGLPNELSASIINVLTGLLKNGAVSLHDGAVIEGLLDGYVCVARRVDSSQITREHFNSALWYHRHRTGEELTEIYQIVWPSVSNGLFPWDDGCPADVIELQTALYLPRADA